MCIVDYNYTVINCIVIPTVFHDFASLIHWRYNFVLFEKYENENSSWQYFREGAVGQKEKKKESGHVNRRLKEYFPYYSNKFWVHDFIKVLFLRSAGKKKTSSEWHLKN